MFRVAVTVATAMALLAGCATAPPPRGVDYPAPSVATVKPPAPAAPALPPRDWRASGSGLDAKYETSALLKSTFYSNPDVLLKQVERSGAMGVNRGWEANASKGDWYIEEQRFADTVIGAGVNRNRDDLIDAGLRAIEWGFARQTADGSFPCKDNYLSTSYFIAATAHALWLLETTGSGQPFVARIQSIRPRLQHAASWLAVVARSTPAITAQLDAYSSRYFVTGYALAATARLTGDTALASAGEETIRRGIARQHSSGYFYELGGFDASFQAEALVYLLRYFDHAATADMRRSIEAPMSLALDWLASRVSPRGIVQTTGNTRSGAGRERDRTGQPRRISAVAVSRAFGLGRMVLGTSKLEALAKSVAAARQPV